MSSLDEQADAELVLLARHGDLAARQQAFAVLVRRYEGFVRAMLSNLCRNRALADDLSQESFLVAWRKLRSLDNPASFRGWLKRLAYRQFLHHYRHQQVEQKHAEPPDDEVAVELNVDDELAGLLEICSPLEQELLILCYGFEFTYAEIAATRHMAVGTVKSHVHRAKQKIQAHINQPGGEKVGEKSHG